MRPAPVIDMVGIGLRLGVSKTRVRQYVAEPGFPEGYLLSVGWVWMTADVEAWIKRRRPDLVETQNRPAAEGGHGAEPGAT